MPRWRKASPAGRCPSCGYDRSDLHGWHSNHYVLCIRPRRPAWTPERARLTALLIHGDTPGEQHERRHVLWRESA